MNNLILALILSFLPVSELRGGLPIAINYALKKNIPIILVFFLVVFINILIIFFVFLFFDYLHKNFMKIKIYKKFFSFYMKRIEKKSKIIERRIGIIGYIALMLFVAVPFPTTGAWTGSIIAWFLKLDRKKSIISISFGVLLAGIIVLLATLGFMSFFKI
ncbi:MAG: small multi-drug export protein [Candidatus Pacearchaeota archaeon]